MIKLSVRLTVVLFFLASYFLCFTNVSSSSESYYKDYNFLEMDKNLAEDKYDKYEKINKLILCDIRRSDAYKGDDSKEWIQSLYYYYITKLHFYDIPYNYIYDNQQLFYTSKTDRDIDLMPILKDAEEGVNIIGVTDLWTIDKEALYNDILPILDTYDLGYDDVYTTNCSYYSEDYDDTYISFLRFTDLQVIDDWPANLQIPNNIQRNYELSVTDIMNEEEIKGSSYLDVTFKLHNNGKFGLYPGDQIAIVTNNPFKHSSRYYLSDWMSESYVKYIDKSIPPGASTEVSLRIKPYPVPGFYHESFVLINSDGKILGNTAIDVNFKTEDEGLTYIKVKDNQYGFLNVRSLPVAGAEIITKVKPDEVYVMLEKTDYWVKIRVNDNVDGWVSVGYVDIL